MDNVDVEIIRVFLSMVFMAITMTVFLRLYASPKETMNTIIYLVEIPFKIIEKLKKWMVRNDEGS